jgi:hypothetical protein
MRIKRTVEKQDSGVEKSNTPLTVYNKTVKF